MRTVPLDQANRASFWQRPIALLVLMAIAMPISFQTWTALLNNFLVDLAGFDGADIGALHALRELPGFLAVTVIAVLLFIREQVLALLSLILLGAATVVTAWYPTFGVIMLITLFSSIGFHYFETVYQSLQLQWLPKEQAPQIIGVLIAVGSASTFVVYGIIIYVWQILGLDYNQVYFASGMVSILIAIYCMMVFPQIEAPTPQRKKIILRRRYWLYYVLQFLGGARRQIFMIFAGLMMVERFGFEVHQITWLYLINLVINTALAPALGRAVGVFGEKRTLMIEYAGLFMIFMAYSGVYTLGWGVWVAGALFVLDHVFYTLDLAKKTYFQKIAHPADIAPTAAVAFTINHIAAVGLPVFLGLLWLYSPALVFLGAAAIALMSFGFSCLIPLNPKAGAETIFALKQWKISRRVRI